MPPFPFIPTVHGHSLYSSHPNLPCLLSTWCKYLKQSPFLSSAVTLNGSCQCTGTHCPAVLLPKTPVGYAVTLQKSNLALLGEGCGMRLRLTPIDRDIHRNNVKYLMHCLLIKNWLPMHPTTANPNSIKKTLKLSNHAGRFAYLVQEQMYLFLA